MQKEFQAARLGTSTAAEGSPPIMQIIEEGQKMQEYYCPFNFLYCLDFLKKLPPTIFIYFKIIFACVSFLFISKPQPLTPDCLIAKVDGPG